MDEVFVKRVFDVRAAIRAVEEPGAIGFVFREEQVGIAGAEQPALAILPVLQFDASGAGKAGGPSRDRAAEIFSPRPGIAKPELWQDMERGGFRAAIERGDANQDVFHVRFGIFDKDIEIAVAGKNSRVEQFKFRLAAAAPRVFLNQLLVGKSGLRILVQHAHVAVRGSRIEIEIALLHILAVIALIPGQAKQAFLEDGIAPVPERERETHHLMAVADSADAVFAPAIRARARMVVRDMFPRGAVPAVIFANRAPLALGKVRSPALPILLVRAPFFEPAIFRRWGSWHRAMCLKRKAIAMVAFSCGKRSAFKTSACSSAGAAAAALRSGDLTSRESSGFFDAQAGVSDKETAGERQALYSSASLRHPSESTPEEATAMRQCPNELSANSSLTSRRFRPLLAVVILVFFGHRARLARAQERPSDDLRRLNQSVDALVKRVSPSPSFLLIADWASQKVAESRARCGFWSDFLTPNFLLPNCFTYSSLARHPRAEPF